VEWKGILNAALWGAISAASLPLGALLGIWLRPNNRWTSSLMSFGGGALIAALTLELVHESLQKAGFGPLAMGCVIGSVLFMALNAALNNHGGFLRKVSTLVSHLKYVKRRRAEDLLATASRSGLLRSLPPEEMSHLLGALAEAKLSKGKTIFQQGDPGDFCFFIESGSASVHDGNNTQAPEIARLGPGDVFGEMALISGAERLATVQAQSDIRAWKLDKDAFAAILEGNPVLADRVRELAQKRNQDLSALKAHVDEEASTLWRTEAQQNLSHAALAPDAKDVKQAQVTHGGAAMAIWLGILLDGIPESLVIGASALETGSVSMALIVGVFLANFPEALSSGVGMLKQGTSKSKIIWLWTSLTILTAIGAGVGYAVFGNVSPRSFAFIEGMAAGAMLSMIAETMLPEAAEQGGPANGLMTVLGFLAAIFVGTLSAH
jgi:CRP-like cAMP-binding protein